MKNRVTELFGIEHPIVQGGMVWNSGWRLAAAVSQAGGLGLIGAGSMYPEVLRQHIQKLRAATSKPFGVNVPLLYPDIEQLMRVIVEEGVPIVFSSAGSPKTWTRHLQQHGAKVAHVVANTTFARKCEEAGVDALVVEGFEAGGHNGSEETTTLNLVPLAHRATGLPLLAAGGIGTGEQMFAALALGADGVQVGSRFAASVESSAHPAFKEAVVKAGEDSTMLSLKKHVPVRLFKNAFFERVAEAESRGASREELAELLGRGRAKRGMFEGELDEGELEIGQVAALIDRVMPVAEIMAELLAGYERARQRMAAPLW